ncbi:AAA family ATPase [Enterobacter asburiae]|uniref:AAA family ATPase n=1 Tax=Enterobacter asburiae TaxID=61645 RepID=UPI002A80752F|nr:AAA family ATPase [Enterobacter asburiae]
MTPLSHSDLKMLLKIHKTITINRLLNKLGGVMYLKTLKVWNFRKYGSSEEIDLNKPNLCLHLKKGLNVLIGENDSGKTAIIDAIKLVLKTHSFEWIKVDENDFYKNTDRLRIQLIFDDMEKEAHHFNEWVEYHRDGDRIHPSLTLSYEVYKKNGRIIQSDINAGSYNQGKALKAEAKEYLKTTYLKPLRDANFDLTPKQNSRLSQILKTHAAFNNKDKNHRLLDLFIEFNTNVSLYFERKDGLRRVARFSSANGHWCKLPFKGIIDEKNRITAFESMTNRSLHELNALRLFLYLLMVRSRGCSHSSVTLKTIKTRLSINYQEVMIAIGYLQSLGLVVKVDVGTNLIGNYDERFAISFLVCGWEGLEWKPRYLSEDQWKNQITDVF